MSKITDLGAAVIPLDQTDLLEVVQDVGGTPINKKVAVSDLGGGAPVYVGDRARPVDTPEWAEEFGDGNFSGWTTLLPTGTLDIAEDRDVLSLKFNGQASSDMAGVVRALPGGLPTIYSIECAYRVWNLRQNYLMAGPFIANGALTTSNVMWWMPFWSQANFLESFRAGTPEAVTTTYGDVERYPYGAMGHDTNLIRLVIDGNDSTIRVERSIDGVQWSLAGSTAWDRALNFTPTHFGFGVSSWGGSSTAYSRLTAVDYMRIYDLTGYAP